MCEGDGPEYELEDFYEDLKAIVRLIDVFGYPNKAYLDELYAEALRISEEIQNYCEPDYILCEASDVDRYNDIIKYCTTFKNRSKTDTSTRKNWNHVIKRFGEFRAATIERGKLLKTIKPGDIVKGISQGDLIWASVYEVLSVDCEKFTITINKANGYNGSQVPEEVHCDRLKLVAKRTKRTKNEQFKRETERL